jgi:glycerophosphoryl diester phosphodiesterase
MTGGPLICAHRGASAAHPENTMTAFTAAVEMDADMIETDVRRDRRGRLVLHHDLLPDDTPELAHLQQLVEFAAGRIALDIELKEAGYEQQVIEMLDACRAGLLVTSFLPETVSAVSAVDPSIETGLIIPSGFRKDPLEAAFACGARVLVLHSTVMEAAIHDRARRAGIALFVWTVNEPEDLRPLMSDDSLAGVITDAPDVAAGLRSPTPARPADPLAAEAATVADASPPRRGRTARRRQ